MSADWWPKAAGWQPIRRTLGSNRDSLCAITQLVALQLSCSQN